MATENIQWNFAIRDSHSKARDPIQGEFFNNEDIANTSDALIRESFQNSLDSKTGDKVLIRVRIAIGEQALSRSIAKEYFSDFWGHLKASYPDNDSEISELSKERCPYIVIEDFGTTGLTGDELAHEEPQNKENNFYYFFRAEGKSGKSGNDKGRWGIGKYVFPKSSKVKAFFALTVRGEGGLNGDSLLMGQAVLKNHSTLGSSYEPDGWFAIDGENVYEPTKQSQTITEFSEHWELKRRSEPGLSVVVPYIDEVSAEDLFQAVIREYMMVILLGQLEVDLSDGAKEGILLNRGNLKTKAEEIFFESPDLKGIVREIDLLNWAINASEDEIIILDLIDGSPDWKNELIPENTAELIRDRLEKEGKVMIRIPTQVRLKKDKDALEPSSFDVILANEENAPAPSFIRQGIRVPSVRSPGTSAIRAIVKIDDGSLAGLLGDAEGPAHTDWDKGRDKFKAKYDYGAKWIDFVKRSPKKILDRARGSDKEGNLSIAADWFPAPTSGTSSTLNGAGPDGKEATGDVGPIPPKKPRKLDINQLVGGFKVVLTEHGKDADVRAVEISAAYATQRGNAFKRWNPLDFNFKDLEITIEGAHERTRSGNTLTVEITDSENFLVQIKGFPDYKRDIQVDYRVAE